MLDTGGDAVRFGISAANEATAADTLRECGAKEGEVQQNVLPTLGTHSTRVRLKITAGAKSPWSLMTPRPLGIRHKTRSDVAYSCSGKTAPH